MRHAIPVLTYHSSNISGNAYGTNDHFALAADLELLATMEWSIRPLRAIVDTFFGGGIDLPAKTLALTFDDGTDFDFVDLEHPTHGIQRSMYNILCDHRNSRGGGLPPPHATSFVVVSPKARAELDRTSMIGAHWWNEYWWRAAIASGMLDIGNHSWEHNHDAISWPANDGRARGTFKTVSNFAAAESEIAQSAAYLGQVAPNPAAALFAYPYGEANDYLVDEYLPRNHKRLGIQAAFVSCGGPITEASHRWRLPRYTCGEHWKSPGELRALLRAIAA